jgi:hypothetical protein
LEEDDVLLRQADGEDGVDEDTELFDHDSTPLLVMVEEEGKNDDDKPSEECSRWDTLAHQQEQ